jgi:hypothetical protein
VEPFQFCFIVDKDFIQKVIDFSDLGKLGSRARRRVAASIAIAQNGSAINTQSSGDFNNIQTEAPLGHLNRIPGDFLF